MELYTHPLPSILFGNTVDSFRSTRTPTGLSSGEHMPCTEFVWNAGTSQQSNQVKYSEKMKNNLPSLVGRVRCVQGQRSVCHSQGNPEEHKEIIFRYKMFKKKCYFCAHWSSKNNLAKKVKAVQQTTTILSNRSIANAPLQVLQRIARYLLRPI